MIADHVIHFRPGILADVFRLVNIHVKTNIDCDRTESHREIRDALTAGGDGRSDRKHLKTVGRPGIVLFQFPSAISEKASDILNDRAEE